MKLIVSVVISALMPFASEAKGIDCSLSTVAADGYASTSVNTAVFRNNAVVSRDSLQYAAYYDTDGTLTLARRTLGSDDWTISKSQYKGNVKDAHNVISIMVDGDGYLHAAFDHHGDSLRYCRSVAPGSLVLGDLEPMTGTLEDDVTYPEFYTLPSGDLIFAYRSGASGRGNLVMNRYDLASRRWERIHDVIIDGENERNAYWQLYVDAAGVVHLSWVWRETWMVETNHDLCYARSRDGGITWERSDGTPYSLPITMSTAEVAWPVPQGSELINQTSMCSDSDGRPYIATYWSDADSDVPQYRVVWHDGNGWHQRQVGRRTTPFSLAGGGTKMIPIARPRMATDGDKVYYIFRDAERGSRVSMWSGSLRNDGDWTVSDLTDFTVDAWEPSVDTELWRHRGRLDIFVQRSAQGDGETPSPLPPQPVYILEVSF